MRESSEGHIHKSAIAIVDNGQIRMDGTYWLRDDDLSGYEDGGRVEDIRQNRAILAKDSLES